MTEKIISIHWLSFTVHAPEADAYAIYDKFFKASFGILNPRPTGGRGYRQLLVTSSFSFKVYVDPGKKDETHFHFELPGQACEFVPEETFRKLHDYLEENFSGDYIYKRIDLAFDHVGFTPEEAYEAIYENKIRSLAKRETLRENASPLATRDDGKLGTKTVYLGSNQSERMIRVYNKRGFTRLEIQTRNKRAHHIGIDIFGSTVQFWFEKGISHLRDYIDFETDWWNKFISSYGRARLKVSDIRKKSLENMLDYVADQAGPTISVLVDVYTESILDAIIKRGRQSRGNRFDHLLVIKK